LPLLELPPSRSGAARSFVAGLLQSQGWTLEQVHHVVDEDTPLVLERGGQRFAAEVKVLGEGRADRALPLLSMAILQAKARARELDGALPLAVLCAEDLSSSLVRHVQVFAERYAEGIPVGVVSKDGFRHFVGHPFDELNAQPRNAERRVSRASHPVVNLFSDLNQWMLKLLLAKEVPETLLSAPRIDYRRGAQLAAAAGVSAMSVSRFLQQLRREGFLDESRGLHLVRRQELFARWRAAVLRPAPEMALRFVLRAPVRSQLQELLARQSGDACLGLFAAAEELQLGHVRGVPAHVLVSKLPTLDDPRWRGLSPVTPGGTPDLILRQTSFPQSVLRGAVRRDDGLVSDVIQTWLDAGHHPARGAEQADWIYGRILRRIIEPDDPR
jgi:hypothetical protein